MAKKKFNPELLKEELKRFRMISEYTFYHEETHPKNDDNLILGTDLEEVDEDPANPAAEPTDDSKTAANAAAPAPNAAPNSAAPAQPAGAEAPAEEPADDSENLFGADAPEGDMGGEEAPMDDMGAEAPAEDEVEVDVTQLVQSGEEAKQAADVASQKTDELLAKFGELEQRISGMAKISDKIEALEKEIIKRNPTPVEKLEMRSMSSFPYNIKLTDYWKDVDGYEAEEQKPKEYVLTSDDVDSFTDSSVKDSFSIPDYEEEDI